MALMGGVGTEALQHATICHCRLGAELPPEFVTSAHHSILVARERRTVDPPVGLLDRKAAVLVSQDLRLQDKPRIQDSSWNSGELSLSEV